jgi:hypothetical protein
MAENLHTVQSDSPPEGRDLSQLLVELQGLKFTVVNGTTAATDIAVSGLTYTEDTIRAVLYFPISTGTVTSVSNLTSEVGAGSVAGAFRLSTTNTTGGKLVVIWFDKGAL